MPSEDCAGIRGHFPACRHKRQLSGQRLGDQDTVKRIFMDGRQGVDEKNVRDDTSFPGDV